MIKRIMQRIESKRGSKKPFHRGLVFVKDLMWNVKSNPLKLSRQLFNKLNIIKKNRIKKERLFILKYGREYNSAVKESKGILHIGAHLAEEAELYHFHNKTVVWVEANPELYNKLNEIVKRYKKQMAINALISDKKDKYYDFKISNNSEGISSSIFDFGPYHQGKKSLWKGDFKMIKSIGLKSETIKSIYEKYGLKEKNLYLLVLDIQGSELLALKGAEEILDDYNYVWTEVSTVEIYKGGVLWPKLKKFINDRGFFEGYLKFKNSDKIVTNVLFKKNLEFNGDTILSNRIAFLVKKENIDNIVETGTFLGNTTRFFGKISKKVYSIESNKEFYNFAKERLDIGKNVKFYFGQSQDLLDKIIKKIDGKTLFFLDAHWDKPCPTPHELDAIAKCKIKPFILIHDFKVPFHRELGWDIYPDFEYKFKNIKDKLDKIYGKGEYKYEYNKKAKGAKRGVILIYPKHNVL
jgi:FkbM family methyltransferase